MTLVAALLTCFNRREQTVRCLETLMAQVLSDDASLEVELLDDGSTDGTSEEIAARFPTVRIHHGDGSLYWCGGMRKAWSEAAKRNPDYYLLLNDDTLLDATAVERMMDLVGGANHRRIGVGAIRDPQSGRVSYGGVMIELGHVSPDGRVKKCDTFNGNAVLIPRAVFREIGMLHGAYTHGMGDFDYGLKATRRGIEVWQTGDFVGSCPRNAIAGSWRDRSLGRRKRLEILKSPKGLPFHEWMEFNRRNSGWRWPIRTISPYLRVLLGL